MRSAQNWYEQGIWQDWMGVLWNMLVKMTFPCHWVNLIMCCMTSVKYWVSRQGSQIGPITPQWGLRQGDPLSPYMFIICIEDLSTLIQDWERNGKINGIKVAINAPKVSHIFFADDSYLFLKVVDRVAIRIKELLETYKKAFGQCVNF